MKEVDKIFEILFYGYDFDEILLFENDCTYLSEIKTAITPIINSEKDKLILDIVYLTYLRKHCFFDLNYDFNDTINNLKKAIVKLIKILNSK